MTPVMTLDEYVDVAKPGDRVVIEHRIGHFSGVVRRSGSSLWFGREGEPWTALILQDGSGEINPDVRCVIMAVEQ